VRQQATIEKQQRYISQLLERIYGKKSERFDPDQMRFDGMEIEAMDQMAGKEEEAAGEGEPAEMASEGKPTRKNRGYNRLPAPEHLERKEIVRDLPVEEKKCKECGEELPFIGDDVTERLDCTPMTLFVNRYVTKKYGECTCGKGDCGVKTAVVEHSLIEKCSAEPGVIATTLVQKFFDHLPFYRQEYIFQRYGVELSRKTMWDWELNVSEGLMPLYELLKKEAFSTGVVLSDDTPVKMVLEKGGTREARIWVCLGGKDFEHCVYEFTLNRSQDGPKEFFKDYGGKLVSDAYGGYEPLFEENKNIIPAGCWSHTRRYFHKALPYTPQAAAEMITLIRGLYKVESQATDFSPADRLAIRQEESAPQMEAIEQWLDGHGKAWLPKSPMGEAQTYITNQWQRLQVYLSDGRVPIDNNAAERAIRPWAIGRKNWMFFFSERGGQAAAVIMSFLQTCRLQGIEPWHYMKDIIARIAGHPNSKLNELLPHVWKQAHPDAIIHTPA
jgi:transposase